MNHRLRNILIILIVSPLIFGVTSCKTSKKNKKYEYSEIYDKHDNEIKIDRKDNKSLYKEVESWLGTPYRYGGESKRGTDCSGMVMQIYLKVYDIKLQRNSARIFYDNCKRIKKHQLREGDLVFFATGSNNKINHVGIYLKNDKFVHASTKRGVIISDLNESYYVIKFKGAGRVKGR